MATIAILFYLLAGLMSFASKKTLYRNTVILIAIIAHSYTFVPLIFAQSGILFGVANSIAIASLFISILLFIGSFINRLYILDIVIYPLIAIFIAISLVFVNDNIPIISYELALHIMLSISAYATLTICAIQSVILSYQDKYLHNKTHNNFIAKLPPLQKTEKLLYAYLSFGTFLLTLALLSGFVFLDDIFAQHLVHKTVLAIASWLIFTAIIISHKIFGLRGKRLIVALQSGFGLLVLAYFGSKLILEEILQKV